MGVCWVGGVGGDGSKGRGVGNRGHQDEFRPFTLKGCDYHFRFLFTSLSFTDVDRRQKVSVWAPRTRVFCVRHALRGGLHVL